MYIETQSSILVCRFLLYYLSKALQQNIKTTLLKKI